MNAFQYYPPIENQQMREQVKKCMNDPDCARAIGDRLLQIDVDLLNSNEDFLEFILMLMILLETARVEDLVVKERRNDACVQGLDIIEQTEVIDGINLDDLQIYIDYFLGEFNKELELIQNTNFGKRRLKLKYVDALYDKYVAFYK